MYNSHDHNQPEAPMTKRLYYDDPYLTCFEAQVEQTLTVAGQPAVILDQTAFYPTSGGQPHDLGKCGHVIMQ